MRIHRSFRRGQIPKQIGMIQRLQKRMKSWGKEIMNKVKMRKC